MILVVAAAGIIIPLIPGAQFLAVGVLMIIAGGFVLRRFLSENPASDAIPPDAVVK